MKKLFLFSCLLIAGTDLAQATITVGTPAENYPGGSSTSVSATVNLSSGGALVILCTMSPNNPTSTPTDSAGNNGNFLLAQHYYDGDMGEWDEWYISNAIGSSADSVSCNVSTSSSNLGITVIPLTGIAATNALNVANSTGLGTTSPITSQIFSTGQPSEIVLGLVASYNSVTYTPTSGYTSVSGGLDGGGVAYQIFSSLQYNQTLSFTTSGSPSHNLMMTIGLAGSSNQTLPVDSVVGGPKLIQSSNGVLPGAGNNWQAVFPENGTSGDTVVIIADWHNTSSIPTPSDSLSTTYTQIISNVTTTTQVMWCGTLGSSGANTVQVGTSNFASQNVDVMEFSGASCTSLAAEASNSNLQTAPTATLNLSTSGALVVANAFEAGVYPFGNLSPGIPTDSNTGGSGFLFANQYIVPAAAGYVSLQFSNPTLSNTNSTGVGPTNGTATIIAAFAPSSFKVTTAVMPDCALSNAYSFQLEQVGASGAVTWSKSGSLPGGLSLNASTGVIGGTPTAGGTYTVTFTATDSLSNTASSSALTFHVGSGFGSIAIVQSHTSNTGCSTGATLSIGTVTSGDIIHLAGTRAFSGEGGNTFWAASGAMTDSLGTVYTVIPQQTQLLGLASVRVGMGYDIWGQATSSGADTITCNALVANSGSIVVTEISNAQFVLDFGAVGWSNGTLSTTSTYSTGSITLPVAGAILANLMNNSTATSAISFNSPFSSQTSLINSDSTSIVYTGYDLSLSAGAQSASITQTVSGSDGWESLLLAIRPAISGLAGGGASGHSLIF